MLRNLLRSLLMPVLLRMSKVIPVDDAWEKREARIPASQFGSGCVHEWSWFFEGQSTVKVKTLEEICLWLSECEYVSDKVLFNEPDYWQHPVTFETTRKGDCEDHALWAWRKLTEIGYKSEFVRGHYLTSTKFHRPAHAVLIFERHGKKYFLDAAVKGERTKMILSISQARCVFCPESSVDTSFKTYRYAGYLLILRDTLSKTG